VECAGFRLKSDTGQMKDDIDTRSAIDFYILNAQLPILGQIAAALLRQWRERLASSLLRIAWSLYLPLFLVQLWARGTVRTFSSRLSRVWNCSSLPALASANSAGSFLATVELGRVAMPPPIALIRLELSSAGRRLPSGCAILAA